MTLAIQPIVQCEEVISIKKFLSQNNKESAEAYERMAHLLLQALGLHAVEGDRTEYDRFRGAIAVLQASLAEDDSPDNILLTAGTAVKKLGDHNWHTSQYIRAKGVELQSIVGMLTNSMSQVSTASRTSIERLRHLQRQIEHASMVEDVRTLKLRLSDCLQSIHGECERQRQESSQALEEIKAGLQNVKEPRLADQTPIADPLTGLLLRPGAEKAMKTACIEGAHVYAGLFVMDRIQSIVSRFGVELGDRAMLFFVQHLSTALTGNDTLFRWSSTSFLALIHRTEPPELVRRRMSQTIAHRTEQSFDIGDRSVVLPVSSSWVIIPLFEQGYTETVKKLDSFGGSKP